MKKLIILISLLVLCISLFFGCAKDTSFISFSSDAVTKVEVTRYAGGKEAETKEITKKEDWLPFFTAIDEVTPTTKIGNLSYAMISNSSYSIKFETAEKYVLVSLTINSDSTKCSATFFDNTWRSYFLVDSFLVGLDIQKWLKSN